MLMLIVNAYKGRSLVTTFRLTGASCHTTFNSMKSDIQTQSTKILVYSDVLRCKKVQSAKEKFH